MAYNNNLITDSRRPQETAIEESGRNRLHEQEMFFFEYFPRVQFLHTNNKKRTKFFGAVLYDLYVGVDDNLL